MKSYKNWKKKNTFKKITIICKDYDGTLEKLLQCIKSVGNTGHGFPIVVDDHDKFYWDGDGSDTIREIKVEDN